MDKASDLDSGPVLLQEGWRLTWPQIELDMNSNLPTPVHRDHRPPARVRAGGESRRHHPTRILLPAMERLLADNGIFDLLPSICPTALSFSMCQRRNKVIKSFSTWIISYVDPYVNSHVTCSLWVEMINRRRRTISPSSYNINMESVQCRTAGYHPSIHPSIDLTHRSPRIPVTPLCSRSGNRWATLK